MAEHPEVRRPDGFPLGPKNGSPAVRDRERRAKASGERWFFALWPDRPAREALAELGEGLIPSAARAAHPLDLHLTLRFLGPLDADALAHAERAAEALVGAPPASGSPVAHCGPVEVAIGRIGHFARSQVLWCGPADPAPALDALAAGLDRSLAEHGFPPDPRPFRAHITLARKVRRPALAPWPRPLVWTARELVLAAGRDGQVPRYAVRRRWPLQGHESGPAPAKHPGA